jgi:hypothetical protein
MSWTQEHRSDLVLLHTREIRTVGTVIGMISVLSNTERTDQLSTSRDVLTVVSNFDDRAIAGGRTSSNARTSEGGCPCS